MKDAKWRSSAGNPVFWFFDPQMWRWLSRQGLSYLCLSGEADISLAPPDHCKGPRRQEQVAGTTPPPEHLLPGGTTLQNQVQTEHSPPEGTPGISAVQAHDSPCLQPAVPEYMYLSQDLTLPVLGAARKPSRPGSKGEVTVQ